MDIVLLIALLPVLASLVSTAFGAGDDSSNWELRWKSLTPADRDRIASATRSGAEFDDPEEAELAAGFTSRRRRRSSYVEAPMTFILVTATALSALGLWHGFTGWALTFAASGTALWVWFGEKRVNSTSRVVAVPDARL
ncbi:MAG: hypothetical protein JST59_05925 [Actinobacteria bacterium]|nr:hypothetical protein [Actinomycetota bacterium]